MNIMKFESFEWFRKNTKSKEIYDYLSNCLLSEGECPIVTNKNDVSYSYKKDGHSIECSLYNYRKKCGTCSGDGLVIPFADGLSSHKCKDCGGLGKYNDEYYHIMVDGKKINSDANTSKNIYQFLKTISNKS